MSNASSRGPPPFGGQAPPIPSHLTNINHAQWQSGYWQANPHYQAQMMAAAAQQARMQNPQSWVPGATWHHQQAQQAQAQAQQQAARRQPVNPYKRVPKPPSAEYLASKLSDNPLGLDNLDSSQSLYNTIPATPWIWQTGSSLPGNKDDDDDEDSDEEDDGPAPEGFTSRGHLAPVFNASSIVRTPDMIAQRRSSTTSTDDDLASRMQRMPIPAARQSSTSSQTSEQSTSSTSSITGAALSDEPVSILSPLIVASTPRPSTSARALAEKSASLGRQATLSTIPEGPSTSSTPIPRTATYPTASTSASAYAAQQNAAAAPHQHRSYDSPSSSRPTSRPTSQQPSPNMEPVSQTPPSTNTRPAHGSASNVRPAPVHHHSYPIAASSPYNNRPTATSSSNTASTTLPPPPHTAPADYAPSKSPPPPNTSGPYPIGFSPPPVRAGLSHSQSFGSFSTNYYQTPPNSASFGASSFGGRDSTPSRTSSTSRRHSAASVGTASHAGDSNPKSQPTYPQQVPQQGYQGGGTNGHATIVPYPTPPSGPSSSPNKDPVLQSSLTYIHYNSSPPKPIDVPYSGPYPHQQQYQQNKYGSQFTQVQYSSPHSKQPLHQRPQMPMQYPSTTSQYTSPPKSQANTQPTNPSLTRAHSYPAQSPPPSSSQQQRSHTYPSRPTQQKSSSPPPPPQQQKQQKQQARPRQRSQHPIVAPPNSVRKGFWNRRGDHLTPLGYIVYAPEHLAYPPDLRPYPPAQEDLDRPSDSESGDEEEEEEEEDSTDGDTDIEESDANGYHGHGNPTRGSSSSSGSRPKPKPKAHLPKREAGYRDEFGTYTKWVERPELPESLPRFGRAPEQPYDLFLQWTSLYKK